MYINISKGIKMTENISEILQLQLREKQKDYVRELIVELLINSDVYLTNHKIFALGFMGIGNKEQATVYMQDWVNTDTGKLTAEAATKTKSSLKKLLLSVENGELRKLLTEFETAIENAPRLIHEEILNSLFQGNGQETIQLVLKSQETIDAYAEICKEIYIESQKILLFRIRNA